MKSPNQSTAKTFLNVTIFKPLEKNPNIGLPQPKTIDITDTCRAALLSIGHDGKTPDVTFENVTFAYEEGKNILENVSFTVNPGESVALVGPTGAGKTTITNLINRFYDIADGKIRYDGININKIRKAFHR